MKAMSWGKLQAFSSSVLIYSQALLRELKSWD